MNGISSWGFRSGLGRLISGLAAVALISGCGGSSNSDTTAAAGHTGTHTTGGSSSSSGGTSNNSAGTSTGHGGTSSNGGSPANGGSTSNGGAASGGGATATGNTCNMPTPGATGVCTSYPTTTIADMRQAQTSGCFELSHVGVNTRTPSPTEPRLYVQDIGGADFSAIAAKCSATASHACSPEVLAKIPQLYLTLGTGDRVSLRGYYLYGGVSQFEQFYIEDIIDECRAVQRPDPVPLTVADIARDARVPANWFQRVSVDIATADPLVMYDFSPPDLNLAATACPDWGGFAMIPQSLSVAAPAACSGTTNPASGALDPAEVLIGRQFFDQFLFSSDCACAAGNGQMLVTPTSSVSGAVRGYLVLEVDMGSTMPYQVFEAAANQTFPIQ